MPSRKFTPGGSWPPSCKYLWTASRPVNTTPVISTSSPTFNARIFSSVKGKESLIIKSFSSVLRLRLFVIAEIGHVGHGLDLKRRMRRDDKGPALGIRLPRPARQFRLQRAGDNVH